MKNSFHAALSIIHNVSDAEDAVQNTYLQYFSDDHTEFDSEEHIKAWLLRTVCNQSKDFLKAFWHRNHASLEDWMNDVPFETPEDRGLAAACAAAVIALTGTTVYAQECRRYSENDADRERW